MCQNAMTPKEHHSLFPVLRPHGEENKKSTALKPCNYPQLTTAAREKTQQCHLAESNFCMKLPIFPKSYSWRNKLYQNQTKQRTFLPPSSQTTKPQQQKKNVFFSKADIFPLTPAVQDALGPVRWSQKGQYAPFKQNWFSVSSIQRKLCDFAQHSSTK